MCVREKERKVAVCVRWGCSAIGDFIGFNIYVVGGFIGIAVCVADTCATFGVDWIFTEGQRASLGTAGLLHAGI